MTHLRRHRWVYALIAIAFVTVFAGCHGGGPAAVLAALWGFTGSWNGDSTKLAAGMAFILLAYVALSLYSPCSEMQADGADTPTEGVAHFYAQLDDGGDTGPEQVYLEGTFQRDGRNITVKTTETAQVGLDSLTMHLQMGETEADGLSGTIEYVRNDTTYEGEIDFERFPER
ncbi:MAG: hypothetical protein R6V19_13705 [Armatimonadota bacterium]